MAVGTLLDSYLARFGVRAGDVSLETIAFRAALDEKLDLARHAYGALSATDGLEVPWPPDLSIVAFERGRATSYSDSL